MPRHCSQRAALSGIGAVLFGLTSLQAHAVDVNGRIVGSITDPSNAVVPGVEVVATNQATGVKFKTKSNASGEYLFPELPVGTYTVSVAAPGFKTFQVKGIVLTIDQEFVEPVHLDVGNATETLEVAADAVQVNTTDMQLDNIVDSKQIVEYPLIGRGFSALELIEPGVQGSSDRFGSNYSVSGAETQQSEYLINGADSNDISLNTLAISPNIDAIDQFNLIDGPLNAEYDRNSGGIVTATLKQGTNHLHGNIFEFYRDTFLNTNNWFQKSFNASGQRTDTIAKYHQNIFGGTIGGPIVKDKLFLFLAYQGTRQVVPESGGNVYVPTASNFAGNFAEDLAANAPTANHFGYTFSSRPIPGTIKIPGCSPGETWIACLGPSGLNGQIPTSAFSPIAVALEKFIPTPNNPAVSPYNYIFHPVVTTKANQDIGRLDYATEPIEPVHPDRDLSAVVGSGDTSVHGRDPAGLRGREHVVYPAIHL